MHTRRALISAILLNAVLLLFAPGVSAQSFTATLTGRVADSGGGALPEAGVTVTHVETNRYFTAKTNHEGDYTVPNLPPGVYSMSVEARGFKKHLRRGVTLEIDQTARLDVAMETGNISETVQITADAPLLNTETGAKGQVVTHEQVIDLPLNGRNFTDLAFLSSGVVEAGDGQGGFASVNGGRPDNVNFVVDGFSNQNVRSGTPTVRPTVDAVQEFKVQTSAYAADHGRLGSGLINVALKSGTNQFHGTLWEFARNDIFDARSFFAPEKEKLRLNQFGGTLGGPVKLPKPIFGPLAYDGRDRTFFFVSHESFIQRRGLTRVGRVPTPAERSGDFSASTANILNPFNQNRPFPNKQIPASMFHPLALELLKIIPLPNRVGINNFVSTGVSKADNHDLILKIDQLVGAKGNNLSFLLINGSGEGFNPYTANGALTGFGANTDNLTRQAGIRYNHVFTPAFFNDLRVSYVREASDTIHQNLGREFAIRSGSDDPLIKGFPRIVPRGYEPFGDGGAQPIYITVNNYQIYDSASWTRGRHTLRFGGEHIHTQFYQFFPNNARGTINILGRWTGAVMGDLLLGLLDSTNRLATPRKNYFLSSTSGVFFQDDVKVGQRLTLNLGLRYDLYLLPRDKFNGLSNFSAELGRMVVAGEPGVPDSLVETDKNNFAPRFGFAWRLPRTEKTVLRGGYGIFYNVVTQNPVRQLLGNNPPFGKNVNLQRQPNNPNFLTLSDPFSAGTPRDTAPNGVDATAPSGYMHQYNLTVGHELIKNTMLEVSYTGSRGLHLGRTWDINQPVFINPQQIVRPFPQFNSTIAYISFGASSNYNALQITLQRRFRRGLSFRANFTYSKSIDDASTVGGIGGYGNGDVSGAQDSRNFNLERGLSAFDRRKVLTLDYVYELPFGRGKAWLNDGGALAAILGNWQFNGIARFLDGQPFTPQLAVFNPVLGEASRPDRIGSGKLDNPTVERWFNLDDFKIVPSGSGRFGTSGRNILTGPGRRQVDMSLLKNFVLGKETRLQFRYEVFNVLNKANFLTPVVDIDVSNAATINRSLGGREMQLALKLIF